MDSIKQGKISTIYGDKFTGRVTLKRKLQAAFALLRRHSWLPWAATLASSLILAIAVVHGLSAIWGLVAAVSLLCSSFVWGYTARTLQETIDWPPLSNWQRQEYAAVWNSLAGSMNDAAMAATGATSEDGLQSSAMESVRNLLELACISAGDDVLEIGCGVGRIAKEIAPLCRSWAGADISANMLAHASARLKNLENTRLIHLKSIGLNDLEENSFDVVYATNMLAHLDEMDRWRYVQEAFRVLRPRGRIFIDNMDMESEAGWSMFSRDAIRYRDVQRPPYMPRFSTAAEFSAYTKRAGFVDTRAHHRSPLVIVTATKPQAAKT
jgi:ubiquinone/menaquinone biosynthesis C-methylase UbiE